MCGCGSVFGWVGCECCVGGCGCVGVSVVWVCGCVWLLCGDVYVCMFVCLCVCLCVYVYMYVYVGMCVMSVFVSFLCDCLCV